MKGNLLIIDDEVMLLEKTAILLEDIADKVFTASSGKAGLDIIDSNEIHCIICDINMPEMNGVDVIKAVREKKFENPFIFYTGHGSRRLMGEAVKYGAFDFLDKPNLDGLEEIAQRGLQEGLKLEVAESENSDKDQFISEYKELLEKNSL